MEMKAVKVSVSNLEKLAEHGSTPNDAIGNLLGNPKVTHLGNPQDNPKDIPMDIISLTDRFATIKSVADLQIKFNLVLKGIHSKIGDIGKRQDDMQEEFNERVNKVISFHVSNTIEGLIVKHIKKLKEELARG